MMYIDTIQYTIYVQCTEFSRLKSRSYEATVLGDVCKYGGWILCFSNDCRSYFRWRSRLRELCKSSGWIVHFRSCWRSRTPKLFIPKLLSGNSIDVQFGHKQFENPSKIPIVVTVKAKGYPQLEYILHLFLKIIISAYYNYLQVKIIFLSNWNLCFCCCHHGR